MELRDVIETVGSSHVRVCLDTGNPVYAAEDAVYATEVLAPYTVSTHLRDTLAWLTPAGAMVQWAPTGRGTVDLQRIISILNETVPDVPIDLEVITGVGPKEIPFLDVESDFWAMYPDMQASALAGSWPSPAREHRVRWTNWSLGRACGNHLPTSSSRSGRSNWTTSRRVSPTAGTCSEHSAPYGPDVALVRPHESNVKGSSNVSKYRVGIIGCGRPWKSEGASGFGMSHFHARGYADSPYAEIVALADLELAHAKAFQERHGGDALYTDYREMLASEQLDMVSICTWPHLHAEMVIAAAEAGVKAIHCEKPMSPTWAEAKHMVGVCEERGVQLTFNHQRRFGPEFRQARDLLRSGAIGELVRLEGSCGNLFDWGTHWFDMFFFYNDEKNVEWVLGQVEPSGGKAIFGIQVEGQAISQFQFENGVIGILTTSMAEGWPLSTRIVGTDGLIEAALRTDPLRVWAKGSGQWEVLPPEGDNSLEATVALGVRDAVEALRQGREPELSSRKVIKATELIFATYQSARSGGRIDLPLDVDDATILATA